MNSAALTQQEEKAILDFLKTVAGKEEFFHKLLDTLGPEGRHWLSVRVLGTTPNESRGNAQFAKLIGARQYDDAQRQALEVASLMKFFEYRKQLLSSALAATKVAEMLGVSRQTIHDRVKSGQLLGVIDNNVLKFPEWQFDPEGPNGVVAGLPEVLTALACNPFAKISWLSSPNRVFEDKRPIDALRQGQISEVMHEAQAVGVT